MRTLRLIIHFYKSFAIPGILISLGCASVIRSHGLATLTALFWFKIATMGAVFYLRNNFRENEMYYYKNLGVSRLMLWIPIMLFDFLLFIALIILAGKL